MAALHVNIKCFTMLRFIVVFISLILSCHGRIHNLKLQNDIRHQMTLSTFGFLKGGTLAVNVTLFSFIKRGKPSVTNHTFGFTLDKSRSAGFSRYMESVVNCIWDKANNEKSLESIFFKFDLQNKRVNIERNGKDLENITVTNQTREQYLFDNHLDHGVNLAALKAAAKAEAKKVTESVASKDTTKSKEKGGDVNSRRRRAVSEKGKTTVKPPSDGKTTANPASDRKTTASPASDRKTTASPASDRKTTASPASDRKTTARPASDRKTTARPAGDGKSTASITQSKPAKPKGKKKESSKKINLVTEVPLTEINPGSGWYQAYFLMHVKTLDEEGLYNLFFHNCLEDDSTVNLTLQIIEDNNGNYLSADEMPIPALYFVFSVVFFVLCCIWISVLRQADEGVYKIHYLMWVVVFFKSISCLFHGVNMYMIQKNGIHADAWAILWYIVYLTRGALMFVTVLLIGAGWAFIKHMFTDREKKLFLIVMPLQILENVAWVIVEESEEGTSSYVTWNRIFMAVDLLCCFAILFPVIWSIRHLQEASRTDGKAAINLNKLKLFRFFYILVVCYIYFTRIIVYLLKITLPFHYGWMRNLFTEVFLLGFFTLTGFKFRPTSDNPYLQVPQDSDEEDIEMEEVMTKTGNMESLTRVNQNRGEEGAMTSMKQRESSHEYD